MVKSKAQVENEKNWIKRLYDDLEKRKGELIREEWYVSEVTPSKIYSYDNGHGQAEYDWTKRKSERVSEYFSSEKEAQKYIDDHVPDDGNTLVINKGSLYRRTVEEWR